MGSGGSRKLISRSALPPELRARSSRPQAPRQCGASGEEDEGKILPKPEQIASRQHSHVRNNQKRGGHDADLNRQVKTTAPHKSLMRYRLPDQPVAEMRMKLGRGVI